MVAVVLVTSPRSLCRTTQWLYSRGGGGGWGLGLLGLRVELGFGVKGFRGLMF